MRKSMLILMLGAVAAGCVSFKPVWYVAPQEFISQHEPGEVLMKTYDGDKRVMRNPTVLNGVVYGTKSRVRRGQGDPFEVPVDSIAVLEVQKFDPGLTFLGFLSGALLVVTVVILGEGLDIGIGGR